MNQLTTLHRRLLYWVYGTLLASGAAWAVLHYLPGVLGVAEETARAVCVWLMKIHGAAAMLALVLLGTLLPLHVKTGLRIRFNTGSGIGMLSTAAVLIATGWLLYYAGSEAVRTGSSVVHLAVGVVLPALLWTHLARLLSPRPAQSGAPR